MWPLNISMLLYRSFFLVIIINSLGHWKMVNCAICSVSPALINIDASICWCFICSWLTPVLTFLSHYQYFALSSPLTYHSPLVLPHFAAFTISCCLWTLPSQDSLPLPFCLFYYSGGTKVWLWSCLFWCRKGKVALHRSGTWWVVVPCGLALVLMLVLTP